jgi:hypothetical protein
LRERRIDAGERNEAARNFDARGAGFRVDSPSRFDRAADAFDLVAQNRFFERCDRYITSAEAWLESKGLLPSAGVLLVLLQ